MDRLFEGRDFSDFFSESETNRPRTHDRIQFIVWYLIVSKRLLWKNDHVCGDESTYGLDHADFLAQTSL